jgi:hypothetical protein
MMNNSGGMYGAKVAITGRKARCFSGIIFFFRIITNIPVTSKVIS